MLTAKSEPARKQRGREPLMIPVGLHLATKEVMLQAIAGVNDRLRRNA